MSMSVPMAIQFIASIQTLTVIDQRQIRSLISVVSIDLNKQIMGNIQAYLDEP